ncbi:MAG: ABC transporter substrate-binding protein [Gemmatimonadaceae bacterium]|nr:ABC transporter substrate-binding protein [Gemmatimonadaceae bacterium]
MIDPVPSLDPRQARFVSEGELAFQRFDGLVEVDSAGAPVGVLAERWEWREGGRVLRLHLRRGTRFHDEQVLTAADVVMSLRATLADTVVAPASDPVVEALAGSSRAGAIPGGRAALAQRVRAVGDTSVDLLVQRADSGTPSALGGVAWRIQRPSPTGDRVGTGRWRPVRGAAGESTFVFRAFAQPWRPVSGADTLDVRILGAAQLSRALTDGTIDCIPIVPSRIRRELSLRTDVRLVEGPPTTLALLVLSPTTPRFADRRVRLALAALFDRRPMATSLGIRAHVPAGGVEGAFARGRDSIAPWPYDPERARALLDSADVTARDTLRVGYIASLPDDTTAGSAGAVGAALRAAFPVRFVPTTDRYGDLVGGTIDAGLLTLIPGSDRPGELLEQFAPGSSDVLYRQAGRWLLGADTLFRRYRAATGAARVEALRAIDAAVRRDQPVVPLWFFGRASASRSGGARCDANSARLRYLDVRPGVSSR